MMRGFRKEIKYICDICDEEFIFEENAVEHQLKHSTELPN